MKKSISLLQLFLTIVIVQFTYFTSNAQENELKVGQNYFFVTNLSSLQNILDDEEYSAKKNYIINISEITDDKIIFTFWNFAKNSLKTEGSFKSKFRKYNYTDQNELKFFALDKERFQQATSPYYNKFRKVDAGIYTVPFKLRLSDFEFESNLSLGTNVIFQWGLNRKLKDSWLIDLNAGVALTKIELHEGNSDVGKENTPFSDIKTSSKMAFTISTGTVLHFSKNVNLGVFWGWDIFSKNDRNINWKYERKPWLGLGINIGLTNSSEKNNQKPATQPKNGG